MHASAGERRGVSPPVRQRSTGGLNGTSFLKYRYGSHLRQPFIFITTIAVFNQSFQGIWPRSKRPWPDPGPPGARSPAGPPGPSCIVTRRLPLLNADFRGSSNLPQSHPTDDDRLADSPVFREWSWVFLSEVEASRRLTLPLH